MSVLQQLEAIDAQYQSHPQALDPAFQAAVIWPALRAADPLMPPALNARGRPGEEHDWPLLFWGVVSRRIEQHRQAEAWHAGLRTEQVVLRWVDERLRAAADLQAQWTTQRALEQRTWGEPDDDVFTPLHVRLSQGVQALEGFGEAVTDGRFHQELARLLVWMSEQARTARVPPQPQQQLHAWLNDTQGVMGPLQLDHLTTACSGGS